MHVRRRIEQVKFRVVCSTCDGGWRSMGLFFSSERFLLKINLLRLGSKRREGMQRFRRSGKQIAVENYVLAYSLIP